jgi:hypothetical protein
LKTEHGAGGNIFQFKCPFLGFAVDLEKGAADTALTVEQGRPPAVFAQGFLPPLQYGIGGFHRLRTPRTPDIVSARLLP